MYAVINRTGDVYPVETLADGGVYLTVYGHPRFFDPALVTILP